MRVARYIGSGEVEILDEPSPSLPAGGLLVQTEACGLCSGELMSWYMDAKIPHVLGHEVCGRVVESDSELFPVGSRVFPHHHAPCLKCEFCLTGRYVHCAQWKRTKLKPGGMADFFGVSAENLTDTHRVDDLRPQDAALIEPLACVFKAIRLARFVPRRFRAAVIGLGNMGLLHMLALPDGAIGYDLDPNRVDWATGLGLEAKSPDEWTEADVVFVCPGSQRAFDFATQIAAPGGVIVNFAPLGPGEDLRVSSGVYFRDLTLVNSYSCGPDDTSVALQFIRNGHLKAEQVCSDFLSLGELPQAYRKMKAAEILKPMVLW
jgi:L-iditol 2-dehydrogenase